jgi:CHAT domain-containing protein/tetratricopeptide (TPR) repeat protein
MSSLSTVLTRIGVAVVLAALCAGGAVAQPRELMQADALNEELIQTYREGRYADALPLAKQVLAIREKALGPKHPDVATSLHNLAEVYRSQGRYSDADPLYKRSLSIWEKMLGPEHAGVAQTLGNLAGLYEDRGRYAEAEPLRKRGLAILEKVLGPEHPDVATGLNDLAELYRRQGRYAEAEPIFKRSLAIVEKALGAEHPDVASSLNNLATLYQDQGRYAQAEPLSQRSLAILEKALGPQHPTIATSLNNLAEVYRSQGRYLEAEPLYRRSLAIREKAFGPEHPEVGAGLNNLAALYRSQARYLEAESLYKRSLAIVAKALGPEHPLIATGISNLALLYESQGRYAEAEPLYKRSLAIREKALGPEHRDAASTLNNLAELYRNQGRYGEAELLYKRTLAILEKALGPEHSDFATGLNNLAGLYQNQSRYAEAEPLLKRSLAIREKALGAEHPDIAESINNLALLYVKQGRYPEAEPLYQRSLAIKEKAVGSEHPGFAIGLNNLAGLYENQGRYAEAEPLYKRTLAIQEKALGPQHVIIASTLNNLALLYRHQDRPAEALENSRRAVQVLRNRIVSGPGVGQAEQRGQRGYMLQNIGLVYALGQRENATESFGVAQLAEISSAGAAVVAATARLAAGGGGRAAVIRERQDLAVQWQVLDGAIVKAIGTPSAERNAEGERQLSASLEEVTKKLDALDVRIARELPEYAELSTPKPLAAEAAQTLLAPDEALLVYLSADDATWLWVLRHDRIAVHKIELGAKALAHEVAALRGALDPDRNTDFAPFPAKDAHALYQKLLGPAVPLLGSVHNLLVVPDGALESLPLAVLVTKALKRDPQSPADHRDIAWLARDYAITVLPTVTSLRALRQPTKVASASAPFLGIGNPVLEGKPGSERGVKLASLFRGALANVDDVRQLEALPESGDELRAIAKTLGAGDKDLLLGEQASEPVLRQSPLDRYRVIQFATHGLVSGDLPGLVEPALVLTPPKEATPENDGLLTASKIATLKLNADWVVLSACNTAAGDGTPDAGGLSGLARAFFYAGAKSLLVSHWKVPSNSTVKLMADTFAELKKDPKIGRAEALRRAEMAMLDPANPPEFAHPLAWAPFVLAGEGGAGR